MNKQNQEAVHAAHSLQQVAEHATHEIEVEQERIKASSSAAAPYIASVSLLPWEAEDESMSILSQVSSWIDRWVGR